MKIKVKLDETEQKRLNTVKCMKEKCEKALKNYFVLNFKTENENEIAKEKLVHFITNQPTHVCFSKS